MEWTVLQPEAIPWESLRFLVTITFLLAIFVACMKVIQIGYEAWKNHENAPVATPTRGKERGGLRKTFRVPTKK